MKFMRKFHKLRQHKSKVSAQQRRIAAIPIIFVGRTNERNARIESSRRISSFDCERPTRFPQLRTFARSVHIRAPSLIARR